MNKEKLAIIEVVGGTLFCIALSIYVILFGYPF